MEETSARSARSCRAFTRYHDGTKHHFHQFARSLGYLDWASQPDPFRSFAGAPRVALYPAPGAEPTAAPRCASLRSACSSAPSAAPLTRGGASAICCGTRSGCRRGSSSATSRWSLRVNPSSGNLHPTEAYVVAGALPGLARRARGLSLRAPIVTRSSSAAAFDAAALDDGVRRSPTSGSIALTSIHWREAWKYGERAFRYCQHDLGHADRRRVALAGRALSAGARRCCPGWSHADDRGADRHRSRRGLRRRRARRARRASLCASRAARRRCQPVVDRRPRARRRAVAARAVDRARESAERGSRRVDVHRRDRARRRGDPGRCDCSASVQSPPAHAMRRSPDRRAPIGRRRTARASSCSAAARWRFDGAIVDRRATRLRDARRASCRRAGIRWDALWWTPRIHLLLFVHRVDGLAPGRLPAGRATPRRLDRLRRRLRPSFSGSRRAATLPLFAPGARRLPGAGAAPQLRSGRSPPTASSASG